MTDHAAALATMREDAERVVAAHGYGDCDCLTYPCEALHMATRLLVALDALDAQLQAADALAGVLDRALPEYRPADEDRGKAWFSVSWVREAYDVLNAYRAARTEHREMLDMQAERIAVFEAENNRKTTFYATLAAEICPFGQAGRMTCRVGCGNEFVITPENVAHYLRYGWPRCCGREMRWKQVTGEDRT